MRLIKILLGAVVLWLMVGCAASGPLYKDVAASFPPVPADKGRVVFFRADSVFGAAVTADIKLNGRVVGKSERGSFFYVDEKPGNCTVATSEKAQVTFTLAPKETKYVRTTISMGFASGNVNPELVDSANAKKELTELHYTGGATTAKK